MAVNLRNSLAARGGSVIKPRPACKPPGRVQVGPSTEHRCLLLKPPRKISIQMDLCAQEVCRTCSKINRNVGRLGPELLANLPVQSESAR